MKGWVLLELFVDKKESLLAPHGPQDKNLDICIRMVINNVNQINNYLPLSSTAFPAISVSFPFLMRKKRHRLINVNQINNELRKA